MESENEKRPSFSHTFGAPPPPPATARGEFVTFADGHQWRVPALTFFDLQVDPDLTTRAFANINWTNEEARTHAVDLIARSLDRNYPGISDDGELLLKLLDFEAAADALKVIWVQNGMKIRELLTRMGLAPPGTDPSPEANQPTGERSTHGS